MRKGFAFEGQIKKLLDVVNTLGFHAHKNQPARLADGTYVEGEPFDYEIILPGYVACFDAKESHDTSWHIKPKDIKQAEHLKHCKNGGADAFFLVYFFHLRKCLKIDVDIVIDLLQAGGKSVSAEYGCLWDISGRINLAQQSRSQQEGVK